MIAAPTQAYLDALYESHVSRIRVKAYSVNATGTKTYLCDIPVSTGTLTVDGGGDYWRTADLVCADEILNSQGQRVSDLVDSYDTIITIEYGIQYTWDEAEVSPVVDYAKVATLRVDNVKISKLGGGLDIVATDEGSRLKRQPVLAPWPAVGEDDLDFSVLEALQYFITDVYPVGDAPTITVDGAVTDTTFKEEMKFEGDRVTIVNDLATLLGAQVHQDENGDWIVAPQPTGYANPADWTIDEGQYGTLISCDLKSDRDNTYNMVYLRYESPTAGSGIILVADNSPSSPTYYLGPYGQQVIVVDNDLVAEQADAQTAAVALLAQYKGLGQNLEPAAVYNPLLIPGDTVEVRRPDGVLETHIVDKVELPLPAGQMTLTTRLLDVT